MVIRSMTRARLALLVLAVGAGHALAQDATAPDVNDALLLGEALDIDPAALAEKSSSPSLKLPAIRQEKTFDVSRTNAKPDGSGTVIVKQQLPIDLDAKIGADLNVAGNNPVTYQPLMPLDAYTRDNRGAAAWASVGVTRNATVDARVDPTNDQGRLAGTLKHSLPVGGALSITLQNSLSVTDTFGTTTPTTSSDIPLMTMPQGTATAPSRVFGNEKEVKFNVLPTGTTLGAGLSNTSDDPVTHNKLSAEQKLLGPLSVSTSIRDVGQTTESQNIGAGFKLNW